MKASSRHSKNHGGVDQMQNAFETPPVLYFLCFLFTAFMPLPVLRGGQPVDLFEFARKAGGGGKAHLVANVGHLRIGVGEKLGR